MEKEIKVDISSREELLERYNDSKVCRDVVEYIIKEAMLVEKNKKIKIVVNKDNAVINENCKELIINGLRDEYKRSLERQHDNNIKQIYFLIMGSILIYLSFKIKNVQVWREILLISGWVPIWEMVKIELFPDVEGRIKRRIINKLLKSVLDQDTAPVVVCDIDDIIV